jgi:phosphohistidine phosphatase
MKEMQLVFFRHGIADPDVTPDSERPLTEEGRRKTRAAAEGLSKLEIPFDKIFTSPWRRAAQTAAIIAEVLSSGAPMELPELAGNRSVKELLDALARRNAGHVLLVGHQPLLGNTVAHLLGAEGKCEVNLRKSGGCAVQVDSLPPRNPAILQWLLTSRQLRALGK